MNVLKQVWDQVSNAGVTGETDLESRRLRYLNQTCFSIAVVFLTIAMYYLIRHFPHPAIIVLSTVCAIAACLMFFAIYLNAKRKYFIAKWLVVIVVIMTVLSIGIFLGGFGVQYFLFIFGLGTFILLSRKEWPLIIIANITVIALFLLLEFHFTPENSYFSYFPDRNDPSDRFKYIFWVLVVYLIGGLFFSFFYREIRYAEMMLEREHARSEGLLLNILPETIAARLKTYKGTIAQNYDGATVLFLDLVGFTEFSSRLSASEVVELLNDIFSRFDSILERYNIEKIKTIGDGYMAAAGIPEPIEDHAEIMANYALDIQQEIESFKTEQDNNLDARIGIHSGSLVAGVIGHKKFSYDIWGDTVNTASRMESNGEKGKIQVSEQTYQILKDDFDFEERGLINVKGKGEMHTFFLMGRKTS